MFTRLQTLVVEKPWGRTDIPSDFGDFGDRRIGEIWFAHPDGDDAQIMVKFLFTSERLSIQVHPDDDAAQAAGYPRGKEECWLVLDAKPDAELGVGLIAETTREALHGAALDGTIVDMIDWRRARADDFVYNQAGTIHAIGAGLTVVEVQQNVDCTYRLYDYGRPRELHLEDGIAVSDPRPYAPYPSPGRIADDRKILVDGPKFVLERLAGSARTISLPDGVTAWLVPVSGKGTVDGVAFAAGECLALTGAVQLDADAGADLLLAYPGEGRFL